MSPGSPKLPESGSSAFVGQLVPAGGAVARGPLTAASSLDRLLMAWLASLRSPHTAAAYRRDFALWQDFAERLGLDVLTDVRRVHVDAWRHERRGDAPATLARRLSAVAAFYRYALREADNLGVALALDHSPAADVRRPDVDDLPQTRALDAGELRALLAAAEKAPAVWGPRDAAVVAALAFNGFRVATLTGLDVGAAGVSGPHRTIAYTVKGGRHRTAALAPPVVTYLDAHLGARRDAAGGRPPAPAEPLLLSNAGRRLSRDQVRRILARCARRAGLSNPAGVTPHVLRATFATLSREAHVDLWDLQEAMDHRDPRTTQRYDKAARRLAAAPGYTLSAHVLRGE